MRFRSRPLIVAGALALAACSSGNAAVPSGEEPGGPASTSTAPTDPVPGTGGNVDWSSLYADYFGPDTPGHCGNAGCHQQARSGFACGATAASCFEGLVKAELVDLASPATSRLGDAKGSPLAWFGEGGAMPKDGAQGNPAAADAVVRWLKAGAPFDARAQPSGAPDASAPDGSAMNPSDAGADADAALPPPGPTWTALYTKYLGAGTPGHCGNSGCHEQTRAGFKCGTTKLTCYQGLVTKGLVTPANPAASPLGDPNKTSLAWFGSGGRMPKDAAVTNAAAANAVKAWLVAGAPNN